MAEIVELPGNDYTYNTFEEETGIFYSRWYEVEIDEEIYRSELIRRIEMIADYPVNYFLFNTQLLNFTAPPEFQKWIAQYSFPRMLGMGVKHLAVVESEDLITQLSLSQAVDEKKPDLPVKIAYFDSDEKARNWILGQEAEKIKHRSA